jgi:type IV pilus biogenesis protein CpaD/CtpE
MKQHLQQQEIQRTGLSIQAPSSTNNETVATAVHQIMTDLSEAVSEEDKIMVVTKIILNLMKKMPARFYRPLKVIAFNANGI